MPKVFDSRAVTVSSASLAGALLLTFGGYLVTSTPRPASSLSNPSTIRSTPVAQIAPSTTVAQIAPSTADSASTVVTQSQPSKSVPVPTAVTPTTSLSASSPTTVASPPTTSITVSSVVPTSSTAETTNSAPLDCSSPASSSSSAPLVSSLTTVFNGSGASVQIVGNNLLPATKVLLCPTSGEAIAPIEIPESATTGDSSQINVNVATLPNPAVTYDVRVVSNGLISPFNPTIFIAVPGVTSTSLGA
ncbi:MAG: hypothetical protein M0019_00255 [Actinomycetota bacterium]|nr:hypothetical protein [Actinomycetota bacterium]